MKTAQEKMSGANVLEKIVVDYCNTTTDALHCRPDGERWWEIRSAFAYLLHMCAKLSVPEVAHYFPWDMAHTVLAIRRGERTLQEGGDGALEIEALREAWEITMSAQDAGCKAQEATHD